VKISSQDANKLVAVDKATGTLIAGVVMGVAGLAMLVLPGQGILTMLIGISLIDFPGKRQLERKLIGQPAVLHTINKVREKFGRPPLTVAHDS